MEVATEEAARNGARSPVASIPGTPNAPQQLPPAEFERSGLPKGHCQTGDRGGDTIRQLADSAPRPEPGAIAHARHDDEDPSSAKRAADIAGESAGRRYARAECRAAEPCRYNQADDVGRRCAVEASRFFIAYAPMEAICGTILDMDGGWASA